VDHITPKAKGGTDEDTNLEATCDDCHKAKTAAEAAEAQGRTVKQRPGFMPDGRPVWPS
jgi:5-methylcytosine-specific restriction endonuclease McrA